jgi:23S rRNA (uracil-5-)-methyltransferase RumA
LAKKKKDRLNIAPEQRTETPPCPYFGQCGGCLYQDAPYSLQVEAKSAWLSELFGLRVETIPSPVKYGYRNRMDFVHAFGKLGLRQAGSHKWVVDIERCALMSEPANRLLARVRELLIQHDIPCYNYLRHEGYLRYAVLRSTSLGETMVNFITATEEPRIEPVIEALAGEADSIHWSIQDRVADVSFGQILKSYHRPAIRERIGETHFLLGPNTFFQNNPYLIGAVSERLSDFSRGRVLDLYCGVGCLGSAAATVADAVLGVDCIEDSIALARENAHLNRLANIAFEPMDAGVWLKEWRHETQGAFDTIIADPPREGLTPKVIPDLLKLQAPRLAYVSCNPGALKQDLALLTGPYRLESLMGFDLFPQTPHVEVVALLRRV